MQIFVDRLFEFGPAALFIYVFDAQQKGTPGRQRHFMVDQGRECMAEMEITIRRGREAKHVFDERPRHVAIRSLSRPRCTSTL
jgi:hypothetical protein